MLPLYLKVSPVGAGPQRRSVYWSFYGKSENSKPSRNSTIRTEHETERLPSVATTRKRSETEQNMP